MALSTNILCTFFKDIKKEHQCFFSTFLTLYSVLHQENEFPIIELRSRGETPLVKLDTLLLYNGIYLYSADNIISLLFSMAILVLIILRLFISIISVVSVMYSLM